METFACHSSIIDSKAKDKRSFSLITQFCFSALGKLSHSLIIPAVAFTTEVWQFWDLLSALFIHPGVLLLQKMSLFNLGVHISPQFCGISNFSCTFLILPNFPGLYDQFFLITDASLSDIASPRFEGFGVPRQLNLVFPMPDSDNTELLLECYYHHHCL